MSKALANKVRLILVLALVMVVSVCAGMFAFAKADVTIDSVDELTTFKMESTSIFYNEEDDKVGLNFTASISAEEFEAIQTLDGFNYGLVIAPENYELTEANLFGDEAIFGWATYDEENYEWLAYEGEGHQVINIYTNDWKLGDGVYTYSGAIVDILPQNIGEGFQAVAYVSAEGLYAFTDAKLTSTAIEVSKLDEVPAYVPETWGAVEVEVYDMGVVAPDFMGGSTITVGVFGDIAVELVDVLGNKITEGDVDFSLAENQRVWTLNHYVQGVLLQSLTFDVVKIGGLFVWNDEVSIASVDAVTYETDDKIKQSYYDTGKGDPTEENIDGIDYVSFTASGGQGTWFAWKPLHSKEYYAAWAGKGITITSVILVDAENAEDPNEAVINQMAMYGSEVANSIKASATYTKTASLDDILANWDAYVGCEWEKTWETRYGAGMSYIYHLHNSGKAYVSFSVDVPVAAYTNKGGDILVNVEEVDDLTALDLTAYMDPVHAVSLEALATDLEFTYEMKGYSIADEIEVTDLSSVDVSEAKLAAYDLVVSSGEDVYYTARIDLYNTTDAVVWADELTEYNVVAKLLNYQIGWPTEVIGDATFEVVDMASLEEGHALYGKTGSYIKITTEDAKNVSVNVKALHSKAYYNEMVGDSVYILNYNYDVAVSGTFRGFSAVGRDNYGMNNAYSTWRFAGGDSISKGNIVQSLDNYLIANSGDETYHGKYLNWDAIGTSGNADASMLQFECDGAAVIYIGNYNIVEAGETLASATIHLTTDTIDLSVADSFDLGSLISDGQQVKYQALCAKWYGQNGKYTVGNAVGFKLVINGKTHVVTAGEDGVAMLNLDDYLIGTDGTVSETETVRSALLEGNNAVTIIGYAPPITSMGVAAWPNYMIGEAYNPLNITIVGPAVEAAE